MDSCIMSDGMTKAVQKFANTPFTIKKVECLEAIFGVKKLNPVKRGFLTASMKMQLKSDKGFTVDFVFEYKCSVRNQAIDEKVAVELLERYESEVENKETPFNYNVVKRKDDVNALPMLTLKFDSFESINAFSNEYFIHSPFESNDRCSDREKHAVGGYTEKNTIEFILSAIDSAETRQQIHKAIMKQVTS